MRGFVHTTDPVRVVFGTGTVNRVREEAERLGARRTLLLSSPSARSVGPVRARLGPLLAAEFAGAAPHTPVEVTERALRVLRESDVDGLVAIGGGSTTGLSKALAVRTGLPQIIVPTTYAGSEVTSVLGETENGRKTTRSDPKILPDTVLYDVDFTLGLPVAMSVTSAVNALAHAVEALYAPEVDHVSEDRALEAIALIARALPQVAARPSDPDARTDLLHAAWLAGTCLAAVGMGLHHKLCHTLGGSFAMPHAATHTVVLPHVMAYNAPAAGEVMRRIARVMGVDDAPGGAHDLIARVGGPTSLRDLGMAETDLARAAELATAHPYPNPREPDRESVEALLVDAWYGREPGASSRGGPGAAD